MSADNACTESEIPSIQQQPPPPPSSSSSPLSSCTLKEQQTKQHTRIPKLRRSQSMRLRTSSFSSTSSVTDYPAIQTSDFVERYFDKELNNLNEFDFNARKTADSLSNNQESPTGVSTQSLPNHVGPRNAVSEVGTPTSATKTKQHGMSLNLTNHHHSTTQRSPRTPQTPYTPPGLPPSKQTPRTPPVTPDSPFNCYGRDDDLDSMYSYSSIASGRSSMSMCDHPYVARNGTTFSGRKMKYVVHCSAYAGQTGDEYLTPTQRAQRQIQRLRMLLAQARLELEQRDSEILRLTKEVVELRLFKASLSSPEDRSNSSDAITVRENNDMKTSQDVSPIVDMTDEVTVTKSSPRHLLHTNVQNLDKMSNSSEMQSSYADSGHFEDITTSSIHSKDSFVQTACDMNGASYSNSDLNIQRQELVKMYEQRIEELIRKNDEEIFQMKTSHSDRVEALLQKLADCNTRYADLVPDYEQAKERIHELEKQLGDLEQNLKEQEDKQNKMYLAMYTKGQESERIAHADKVLEFAHQAPNRVSIPELIHQLQVTQSELDNIRDNEYEHREAGGSQVLLSAKEAVSLWLLGARKTMYRRLIDAQQNKINKVDPEVTLQFLKSAVYYFLTDKENSQGHLNAIESILGFSDLERLNIDRARAAK